MWEFFCNFAKYLEVEKNPYIVDSPRVKKRVRLVAVNEHPLEVIDRVTGEVKVATPYVGKRMYRDVSEFVKVYGLEELVRMGLQELKVLFYVMDSIDFEGSFRFEKDKCIAFTGLSRASVFRGLKRLRDRDVIRKKDGGHYWINPNIAFRGNRDELLGI